MPTDWTPFPKVELHRHLEGSLRLDTLAEIARQQGFPEEDRDPRLLAPRVSVVEGEPADPGTFLSKFSQLRRFFVSAEVARRAAREAVEDAARDGVAYLELRFNPVAWSVNSGLSLGEAADRVIEGVEEGAAATGLLTRLIVSVNRVELDTGAQLLDLAAERRDRGVAGLDLTGDEAHGPAEPFEKLFERARDRELGITVHAGEWAGPENVRFALEKLGARRIGHGIRVMDDPEALKLAREHDASFEVCISSNVQTGAVAGLEEHPLGRMMEAGLNVTLNTDDPEVSGITLSGEWALAEARFGLGLEDFRRLTLRAAGRAFLPVPERAGLLDRLEEGFRGRLANS